MSLESRSNMHLCVKMLAGRPPAASSQVAYLPGGDSDLLSAEVDASLRGVDGVRTLHGTAQAQGLTPESLQLLAERPLAPAGIIGLGAIPPAHGAASPLRLRLPPLPAPPGWRSRPACRCSPPPLTPTAAAGWPSSPRRSPSAAPAPPPGPRPCRNSTRDSNSGSMPASSSGRAGPRRFSTGQNRWPRAAQLLEAGCDGRPLHSLRHEPGTAAARARLLRAKLVTLA